MLPLYESERMFWRVHGKCAGPERSDGRGVDPPLLDLLLTRCGTGYANEENRMVRTPSKDISPYRNQVLPGEIPHCQAVIVSFDHIQVLPQIHVFLDPPSSLFQATR